MIAGEALCQLVLYLTLPYFSLLRALMSYSWFCDQTTHQSHPMALVAYSFVCFGALVLHATCYYPKPAQSGQIDPLMTVDWDEVTARTARFRAREIAGIILNTICLLHFAIACTACPRQVAVGKWPYVCTAAACFKM